MPGAMEASPRTDIPGESPTVLAHVTRTKLSAAPPVPAWPTWQLVSTTLAPRPRPITQFPAPDFCRDRDFDPLSCRSMANKLSPTLVPPIVSVAASFGRLKPMLSCPA